MAGMSSATVSLSNLAEIPHPSGTSGLDDLMHCSLAMDQVHREDFDMPAVVPALDRLHDLR